MRERWIAKLAEQNSSDRVKGDARTLLRDHQDTDVKVKELAKKKGIALSDTPKDPEIRKHMESSWAGRRKIGNRRKRTGHAELPTRFACALVRPHSAFVLLR